MLPAHTQEAQSEAASVDAAAQAVGFGKVLTSIHGLQRRLDDFSVDDVTQAETNVHSLIQQLSVLQLKLNRLAELNHFVSSTNSLISEIPEENFDQVDLDGLENHPQLHAIIHASKLIRVYKLMKAAKAGAEAVSFDSEAGELHFAATLESAEPDAISPVLPADRAASLAPATTVTAPMENEVPGAMLAGPDEQTKNLQHEDWVFSADTELDNGEPQFVDSPHPAANDTERHSSTQDFSPPTAIPIAKEASFDERLLSDLIQTYGEFSPGSNLPAAPKEPITGKLNTVEFEASSLPEITRSKQDTPKALAAPVTTQRNVVQSSPLPSRIASADSSIPNSAAPQLPARIKAPESIGLKSMTDIPAMPAPVTGRLETKKASSEVASVNKNGELDRQLKSIIKDYGEYDLYSHQSSTNIKKAVAIAFALLALVLGCFYFFKTPAPRTDAPLTAVTPLPTSSSASDGGTAR